MSVNGNAYWSQVNEAPNNSVLQVYRAVGWSSAAAANSAVYTNIVSGSPTGPALTLPSNAKIQSVQLVQQGTGAAVDYRVGLRAAASGATVVQLNSAVVLAADAALGKIEVPAGANVVGVNQFVNLAVTTPAVSGDLVRVEIVYLV